MAEFKTYRIASCDDVVLLSQRGSLSGASAFSERWIDDIEVSIPQIAYGQISQPTIPFRQWPPESWNQPSYTLSGIKKYTFENAVIHTELGIITVGDMCLRESLHMVFPETHGFPKPSEDEISLPVYQTSRIDDAYHAMCGYVGNRNYAHWWIDVLAPVAHQATDRRFGDAVALLPQLRARYQSETVGMIIEDLNGAIFVPENEDKIIGKLQFVPRLTASDYFPQPNAMKFIERIKSKLGIHPQQDASRRVYLSRRDASARKMLNEDNICAIASQNGYEVVTTGGLSVADQIRLFAQASHIVSPHGAGLANMLFCRPGTRILELHYHSSINWSLRRLASIIPASYGCILGHQTPKEFGQTDAEAEQNGWTLPEDTFSRVISESPFV